MSPRKTLSAGPFKGVRDTGDPYDDVADPGFLQDAQNGYIPDESGGGFYARPGFRNGPASITATTQAACIYSITMLDGTIYRFAMCNGALYRFTTTAGEPLAVATDVTPVGVTISNSATPTARFYMTAFADQLIVSDGVNRPWRGTNLSATPITGTYIDIDGAAGAWTAQGAPVVYSGSLFFIAKTVPGGSSVKAGVGIVWSEPFQPDVGYVQTTYANFWNLIEQSADPVYALAATNNYLYYFRERSIGGLSGAPGSNFSTTASSDMVSSSVGCTAPASIVQFGDAIFFLDRLGRPHMFRAGEVPEEIWQQLRGQISSNPTFLTYPVAVALVGVGVLVSQLDVVLLGGWSATPTASPPGPPATLYAFRATDGTYLGRWNLTASLIAGFAAVGEMKDTNKTPLLTIVGQVSGGTAYRFFTLQPLGLALWTDGESAVTLYVPSITTQTQRLGYSATEVMNATDVGTVLTQSTAPLTITVKTPYTSSTTETTAMAANSSSDGTYRVSFGMDVMQARGIQVTVMPTTAATQWVCQHITFPASPSKARTDDQ